MSHAASPPPTSFSPPPPPNASPPAECLVIEDSVPGVRGATAAGMRCLGYAPHDEGAALAAAGAVPFHSLFALPEILRSLIEARS